HELEEAHSRRAWSGPLLLGVVVRWVERSPFIRSPELGYRGGAADNVALANRLETIRPRVAQRTAACRLGRRGGIVYANVVGSVGSRRCWNASAIWFAVTRAVDRGGSASSAKNETSVVSRLGRGLPPERRHKKKALCTWYSVRGWG